MKHKKIKMCAVLLFFLGFTAIHSQNALLVKNNSESSIPYAIAIIKNITFPTGNMLITKKDNSTVSYVVSNIKYMYFGNDITTIQHPKFEENTEISVYPNPVIKQLNVQYYSFSENQGNIQILDMQGRIVLKQKMSNHVGLNTAVVDASFLQQGFYLCYTNTGNKIEITKFLKSE